MAIEKIHVDGLLKLQGKLLKTGVQGGGLLVRVLTQRLKEAVGYARQHHLSGGSATTLYSRSGDLRNAFWYDIQPGSVQEITARLGFIRGPSGRRTNALRYAWTHEGLVPMPIRPKRAKYLRIPAPGALTAAGRLKAQYDVADARTIPNTRIIRAKSGRLAIWEIFPRARRVKGQPLSVIGKPLFWLARQVTIPARPVLAPTWHRFKPLILTDLRQGLAKLLGSGTGGKP